MKFDMATRNSVSQHRAIHISASFASQLRTQAGGTIRIKSAKNVVKFRGPAKLIRISFIAVRNSLS